MQVLHAFCLLAVVYGLRTRLPSFVEPPDFLVCNTNASCAGESALPSFFMGTVLMHGYARARAIAAAGRHPAILHIGADGLQSAARWADVDLYKAVLSGLDGVPHGTLKLAFVEPVEAKSGVFWGNVKRLPIDPSQVQLVTGMVAGNCDRAQTLFRISDRAARDFGFSTSSLTDGWVTGNRDRVMGTVRVWVEAGWRTPCPAVHLWKEDCSSGLRKLYEAKNFSSYVEVLHVPCFTVQGLVEEVGVAPEDVAMLIVDAEGFDAEIINSTLGIAGFRPGFIQFEGPVGLLSTTGLAKQLTGNGYSVGFKGVEIGHGGDNHNIIAVLPTN